MSKINPQHATVFIVAFAVLAICINVARHHTLRQQGQSYVSTGAQQAQLVAQQQQFQEQAEQRRTALAKAEAERQAIADAAAKHAAYLARYLTDGIARTSGMKMLAVVAAAENRSLNFSVAKALGQHFKTGNVETVSTFFTPEFVSDGLFTEVFNGSTSVFKNLELARSLDAVVLARQTVQYSKDASLENLVSASMQLEVMLLPVGSQDQPQSWTFTAYGAGFNQKTARAMAEERIIKQIANDTKMSF